VSRIGARLLARAAEGRKGFVAFVTAGDPSLERLPDIAAALERGGVDVLELGVPFSDPLLDGPVIQRSSDRAVRRGVRLPDVLRGVREIRRRTDALPIVLFSYLNPLLRHGLARVAADARAAGVDGVLVTDLPPEEADEWRAAADGAALDTIFLAAPTSPDERLRRIA
jgi:tryptophan synthase alpha chain